MLKLLLITPIEQMLMYLSTRLSATAALYNDWTSHVLALLKHLVSH